MSRTLAIVAGVLAALLVVQTVRLHRLEEQYIDELRNLTAKGIIPIDGADASADFAADGVPGGSSLGPSALRGVILGTTIENKSSDGTRDATTDKNPPNASPNADFQKAKKRQSENGTSKRSAGNSRSPDASSGRLAANRTNKPRSAKSTDLARQVDVAVAKHWVNDAQEALARGEFDVAADLLGQTLSVDPANREAFRTLARLNHQLGFADQEIATYQEWIAARPDDPLPHYLLALAYQQMGIHTQAADELNLYQNLSDGSLNVYAQAANLYRRLGMYHQEGALLSQWAQEAPNSPDARRSLADYYLRMGNYQAALVEYQQAVNLTPNNVNAHLSMAQALTQMGLYADAQDAYLAALNLRPADPGIRLQLAQSYRTAGDLTAALDVYQSVIDMDPNSREATRAARAILQIQRRLGQNS